MASPAMPIVTGPIRRPASARTTSALRPAYRMPCSDLSDSVEKGPGGSGGREREDNQKMTAM